MEYNLYIIELTDNRFFIHHQQNLDDSDSNKIMENCSHLFKFVYKYKPIKILDIILNIELLEVDRYVLQYMEKFGVDVVRGGSYIDEILPGFMTKSINVQLNTAFSIINTQSKIERYDLLKMQFESIKYFIYEDKQYCLNHDFLTNEFKWLYDHIDRNIHNVIYSINNSDEIMQKLFNEKYELLLIFIKQLPRLYLLVNKYQENDNYHNIDKVFFENANLVFDKYIYAQSSIIFPNDKVWKDYHNIIMFFYHVVINHLDEIEFELFAKTY